ncbi:MAG TPA: hypothetical protein VK618_04565, partial [Flavitalea sp.]|nr:hypothetical protein [Flavitalea sp.]
SITLRNQLKSELLIQAQEIKVVPGFDDLSLGNPRHGHAAEAYSLPGLLVRRCHIAVGDFQIFIANDLVGCNMNIGEIVPEFLVKAPETLGPAIIVRIGNPMRDSLIGHKLIDHGLLIIIPNFLKPSVYKR